MKRSQMKTLLLIEGAVCLTLTLALRLIEGAAFPFAAFPGSAAGQGLSMLAGTGRFGFALALTLYAFLALLPLYALARIRARRDWKAEDTLLGLCSLAVAGALFPRVGSLIGARRRRRFFRALPGSGSCLRCLRAGSCCGCCGSFPMAVRRSF